MKTIPLTQGKHAIVDDEDYLWLSTWNWYAKHDGGNWYAHAHVKHNPQYRTVIAMHRLLLMYPKKGFHTDHVNHNGLDNRKQNLRVVTNRENQQNRKNPGKSKYPGVYFDKGIGKWRAQILYDGRRRNLGGFSSETEAYNTYVMECRRVDQC